MMPPHHTNGTPINWAINPNNTTVTKHPLYIKYNNLQFADILAADVKTSLNGIVATAGSSGIVAYLSWLLRVKALLV